MKTHATMKAIILHNGGRLQMLVRDDVLTPCGKSLESIQAGIRNGAFAVITSTELGSLTVLRGNKRRGYFDPSSGIHPTCPKCLDAWRTWRVTHPDRDIALPRLTF
jgi:hypothetical protein